MQKITIRNTETGEETEATPEQLARFIEEQQLQLQNQYNVLTDLRKEFAELKKQNQWQPIDTAPKDRGILVCEKDFIAVAQWQSRYSCFYDGENPVTNPTHWMPLPKAPEAE